MLKRVLVGFLIVSFNFTGLSPFFVQPAKADSIDDLGLDAMSAMLSLKNEKKVNDKLMGDMAVDTITSTLDDTIFGGMWTDITPNTPISDVKDLYKNTTGIFNESVSLLNNLNDGKSLAMLANSLNILGTVTGNKIVTLLSEALKVYIESEEALEKEVKGVDIEQLYGIVDKDRRLMGIATEDNPPFILNDADTINYFYNKYVITDDATRALFKNYVENVIDEKFPKMPTSSKIWSYMTMTSDDAERSYEMQQMAEYEDLVKSWVEELIADVNVQAKHRWAKTRFIQRAAEFKSFAEKFTGSAEEVMKAFESLQKYKDDIEKYPKEIAKSKGDRGLVKIEYKSLGNEPKKLEKLAALCYANHVKFAKYANIARYMPKQESLTASLENESKEWQRLTYLIRSKKIDLNKIAEHFYEPSNSNNTNDYDLKKEAAKFVKPLEDVYETSPESLKEQHLALLNRGQLEEAYQIYNSWYQQTKKAINDYYAQQIEGIKNCTGAVDKLTGRCAIEAATAIEKLNDLKSFQLNEVGFHYQEMDNVQNGFEQLRNQRLAQLNKFRAYYNTNILLANKRLNKQNEKGIIEKQDSLKTLLEEYQEKKDIAVNSLKEYRAFLQNKEKYTNSNNLGPIDIYPAYAASRYSEYISEIDYALQSDNAEKFLVVAEKAKEVIRNIPKITYEEVKQIRVLAAPDFDYEGDVKDYQALLGKIDFDISQVSGLNSNYKKEALTAIENFLRKRQMWEDVSRDLQIWLAKQVNSGLLTSKVIEGSVQSGNSLSYVINLDFKRDSVFRPIVDEPYPHVLTQKEFSEYMAKHPKIQQVKSSLQSFKHYNKICSHFSYFPNAVNQMTTYKISPNQFAKEENIFDGTSMITKSQISKAMGALSDVRGAIKTDEFKQKVKKLDDVLYSTIVFDDASQYFEDYIYENPDIKVRVMAGRFFGIRDEQRKAFSKSQVGKQYLNFLNQVKRIHDQRVKFIKDNWEAEFNKHNNRVAIELTKNELETLKRQVSSINKISEVQYKSYVFKLEDYEEILDNLADDSLDDLYDSIWLILNKLKSQAYWNRDSDKNSTVVSQADKQKIVEFYRQFKDYYEQKSSSQLVSMISDDWECADGTDLMDMEDNLRNMFMVFDTISYQISSLNVQKLPNGTYKTSYIATIEGKIYEDNITHKEKSNVTEILKKDSRGKFKVFGTLTGNFWYIK